MKEDTTREQEEIAEFAEMMGVSKEEYLTSLHNKNKTVKDILLQDRNGYKQFLEDYHSIVDDLKVYKNVLLKEAKNSKDEQILSSAIDLFFTSDTDPTLLVLMYEQYLKQKETPVS